MHINFVLTNRFIILIALCLFSVQFSLAQTPTAEQIAAKVDEYMNADGRINRFSGLILVTRDGQPVVSKGYDTAIIAGIETGAPADDANRPDAGQTSKRRFTETWIKQGKRVA